MPQDWFANLTGFREQSYELTRSRLVVEGDELVSTVNGKRYGIGALDLPTLAGLRSRVAVPRAVRSALRCVSYRLHPGQTAARGTLAPTRSAREPLQHTAVARAGARAVLTE
jgi:hypothetical protein